MILQRPEPLYFSRSDRSFIIAPPATRAQMREIFVIDREVPYASHRRQRTVEILLQGVCSAEVITSLTEEEAQHIIYAFSAQNRGIEPGKTGEALRESLESESANITSQTIEEVLADHDATTLEIAVLMRRPPAEIEAMGYVESLSWLSRYVERESDERRFAAAIHGMELA